MRFTLLASLLLTLTLTGCDTADDLAADLDPAPVAPSELRGGDDDDCGCDEVEATIRSVADFSTFTTEGTITGDLRGTTMFTGDAASLTPITSETFPPQNPATLSYTGQLEIATTRGTLRTLGVGAFEAGPGGVGVQFDRIVGGTGAFDRATGTLFFHFVANEAGDRFTSAVSGEVCTPCDDDDDDDEDEDDD